MSLRPSYGVLGGDDVEGEREVEGEDPQQVDDVQEGQHELHLHSKQVHARARNLRPNS
jgi:hypothetical protein